MHVKTLAAQGIVKLSSLKHTETAFSDLNGGGILLLTCSSYPGFEENRVGFFQFAKLTFFLLSLILPPLPLPTLWAALLCASSWAADELPSRSQDRNKHHVVMEPTSTRDHSEV